MKDIIASIKRKVRKADTINKILRSEQTNTSVINIHRIDKNNVGDFYCAPHHYFDVLNDKALDIFDYKSDNHDIRNNFIKAISENALIVGGGGLLNRSGFAKQMSMFEKLTQRNKKIVLWGVGHNEKHKRNFKSVKNYSVDTTKFGLVGTRDYGMPGEYVPCVSCLHPIFDKDHQETQDLGIIFHKDTLKKEKLMSKLKNYSTSSNTTDLKQMIDFIGKSRTVVTDSYHAMYWSMLMDKKVVAIPNSSKFFDFKYQPTFATFDTFEQAIKKAQPVTGVLEECREINLKFADKVFNYLNL